ncbi:cytochrome B [Vibrio sp. UCD-FRSSP16_10]|uniref:COX15/CtaA family protein n=1 Tax=unclassified Vibrio TaxID=2614977 RepID=UPI0007FD4241|nr:MULTISPECIES: COX15/CtaA family protein [unclassified Vibrio]OBT16961.1 cytochrome B [Vibrio sp. UCD-FRSSP16_30]OBT21952.1 cytochrome B [Vibrio sp. UCD-FRSSP16_10]
MQGRILLQRLTWLALAMTLVVIALGAYTRLADAGLGCPDWPGCYGQIAVPTQAEDIAQAQQLFPQRAVDANKAWLEMIHRYFAGTLGLVVFALSFLIFKSSVTSKVFPLLLSGVIIAQAALGMWTVTLKLMPVIVMLHLLGGFTLFSLLTLLMCHLRNTLKPQIQLERSSLSSVRRIGVFATLVLVVQIMLGGWTSSNYAALMCTSLPICQGEWQNHLDFKNAFNLVQTGFDNYEFGVLDYGARMTIHVTHRVGALLTSVALLALMIQLWRTSLKPARGYAKVIGIGLVIQIGLGIANVVFHLPLVNAVMHNLGAALLLVTLVSTQYFLWVKVSVLKSLTHDSKREYLV